MEAEQPVVTKRRPKPIAAIEPFTGKAARWLTKYLDETHADPAEQAKENQRIRKSAARAVCGMKLVESDAPQWRYHPGDSEPFPFKVRVQLGWLIRQERQMVETLRQLTAERERYEATLAIWEKLQGASDARVG